jgi:hypothetical protein
MAEVPQATPISDAQRDIDHFVWVTQVRRSKCAPRLHVVHANFFDCHIGDSISTPPLRWREGPFDPARVLKNVYNLTPVFTIDSGSGLVMNAIVCDLLTSCCTAEFREVIIDRAFWFPYGPGDDSFETSSGITMQGSIEEVIERFAKAYACSAPAERYYHMRCPVGARDGCKYADLRSIRVGVDAPTDTSIYARNAEVSRAMIQEHGVVFVGGHALRPDVFERLNPYLHRPWFWAQRYAYPD